MEGRGPPSICELVSSTPQSVPKAAQLEDTVSLTIFKKLPVSKFNQIYVCFSLYKKNS